MNTKQNKKNLFIVIANFLSSIVLGDTDDTLPEEKDLFRNYCIGNKSEEANNRNDVL